MRKQYCLEWTLQSGHSGWKSIGHDCEDEAIRQMKRKIKTRNCLSAWVTWNYTGHDIPENEFGEDHFLKGLYKKKTELNILGSIVTVIHQDEIEEMEE